ncbi:M42 family metallopeptidase [Deinococcus apachensis]|uniref:M42 family metallopeptidase n=1 Tax=Deinococcus apachensis TaxID=309886 RepID=UPI00037715F1|nr:M42 family metallopeptidase [Deinococcus apachensis]
MTVSPARPVFDLPYTTDLLLRLLNTPSPTGFTDAAVRLLEAELDALGVPHRRSKKGALTWEVAGTAGASHTTFSGHVDTLGAMVKEVKECGRLRLAMLGGYDWATVEGEYVRIHLQNGAVMTGTIVNTRQSTHVHGAALRDLKREQAVMEVRLDARTSSDAETRALGIEVGDFVSLDPRAELTDAGYIKSRHLDNKAAVAVFLGVTRALLEQAPTHTVAFHVTTYEEVGHGAATGIPAHTDELVAVDMAAVGEGQTSSEHHVTLCVADSGGPYDHALGNRMRAAARRAGLDLKVDLYPYYSSDGTAAWRAGGDYPVALIGPGVDASHAYERTHTDALRATAELMLAHVRAV